MTPLDLGLAASGRLAAAVERRAGPLGMWLIVLGLVAISAVWVYLIGSSQRPTDLSFDDIRFDRIPAMTSWVRVEGDLRPYPNSDSLYQLHDLHDDALYLIVISDAPLALGPQVMTGQISAGEATTGNIGSLDPDIPPVPKQNEPFAIILLPAAIGGMIVLGRRIGYPIVRRERRGRHLHGAPLAPGEAIPARRSGRIGSTVVPDAAAIDCTVGVRRGDEVHEIVLTDAMPDRAAAPDRATPPEHVIRVRRSVPVTRLRVCRTSGCIPGVRVHAQTADLMLLIPDRAQRDRLLTTLG
jgi:hypothetical protein